MLKVFVAFVLFLTSLVTAWAQNSPWVLRVRAVQPKLSYVPNDIQMSVDQKAMPEVYVSYFFTPRVALEVGYTALKNQSVYANGTSVGTFQKLPPTLMLQYHADSWSVFKPYVGAGITYTKSSTLTFTATGYQDILMNNHTWGPAVQVGLDVPLDDRFSLNLDVKRSNFRSDISAFGQTVDTKINSRVVSLGLGYRF